jgi:uncharacterized protein involved in outer membrane biogenesis
LKKSFRIIGISLIVVLVAAFLGPRLVQWNEYKAEITSKIGNLTGRKMLIEGDIWIAILPTPTLIAQGVSISNPSWAVSPELAKFGSIEVRLAVGPLLSGQFAVESVHFVEPVIALEIGVGGQKSWSFGVSESQVSKNSSNESNSSKTDGGQSPVNQPISNASSSPSIVLHNVIIEDGIISYRDNGTNLVERIQDLNGNASADSLKGPYEGTGSMVVRGGNIDFAIKVGEVKNQRSIPIDMKLGVKPSGKKFEFNGGLTGMGTLPRFKSAAGGDDSMAELLNSTGVAEAISAALRGFSDLEAAASSIRHR